VGRVKGVDALEKSERGKGEDARCGNTFWNIKTKKRKGVKKGQAAL
jgi:hypothetical protein